MKPLVVGATALLMAFASEAIAQAGAPDGATVTISAQALGTLDAVLLTCRHLNPDAAGHYQERSEAMTQGTGAKALAELRSSEEYRQVFEAVTASVGQVDRATAVQACTDYLAGSR